MNEQIESVVNTVNQRYLVKSAVAAHAKRCSAELRAGKFKRVGQTFLDEIQAELECAVRNIDAKYQGGRFPDLVVDDIHFVTGECLDKLRRALDGAIARLIQRRVETHPSVGQTLQGK